MVAELAQPITWKFTPHAVGVRTAHAVRLWANGTLLLSGEVVECLGKPRFVSVRLSTRPPVIALKGMADRPSLNKLKLTNNTGGAKTIYLGKVLKELGRTVADGVSELRYAWNDGYLLIDCSALPLAGGSDGR